MGKPQLLENAGLDLGRISRALKKPWTRARATGIAYRYGFWRTTLWLSAGDGLHQRVWRAVALKNLGDAGAAAALIDEALTEPRPPRVFHVLMNPMLDVLIALGRYGDALRLEPSIPGLRDWQWALAQSNLAEAEYCQGNFSQAHTRLSQPALDAAAGLVPLAKSTVALQRAWLAAQLGDAKTALNEVARVSAADSPRSYRAEWYFTAAAAHSLAGDAVEADAALEAGSKVALRSSSIRNALALRGVLMRARGKLREAEHWLSRAATHRWRKQGGNLLLSWGDVLSELGRADEARSAWKRAIAEDPESDAAVQAAKR